ncbi:MAG: DNA alkylation repair protein [Bacilli bacterium]|nr:DNA alkylation repair protein [Bacilli bacterium]
MDSIIINELKELKNDDKIKIYKHFFKTGPGEYGEGDLFFGVSVPLQRKIAKKYLEQIDFKTIRQLIRNKYHEVRLTTLIILTYKMKKANLKEQKEIYNLYLNNTNYINNWDLVDISAPNIIGAYLYNNYLNRDILYTLANSNNLWEQRIAILSTLYFIRNNDYRDTLKLALILINHKHDLIHKAVGWMLREVGNKDYQQTFNFLQQHYQKMPRTMLRYAIENFDEEIRQAFLKGTI